MTITNVIIKTPDRVWMTSCPEAMGWEFGDFEKDVSWDPTLGRASPAGGYGMRSAFVGSDSKNYVSLSSCRKTKVKKWINVSYLNNEESSVFRISLHLYIRIVVLWLYNTCCPFAQKEKNRFLSYVTLLLCLFNKKTKLQKQTFQNGQKDFLNFNWTIIAFFIKSWSRVIFEM